MEIEVSAFRNFSTDTRSTDCKHKRGVNHQSRTGLILLGLVFGVSCVYLWVFVFILSVVSFLCQCHSLEISWKDLSEMTYCVLSGSLNFTHSLAHFTYF